MIFLDFPTEMMVQKSINCSLNANFNGLLNVRDALPVTDSAYLMTKTCSKDPYGKPRRRTLSGVSAYYKRRGNHRKIIIANT